MEGEQVQGFASAGSLARLIHVQMALRAAIELSVFDIIASSGPKAQLSAAEIVAKIPTTNPDAASCLERILRVLGVKSILSMSSRPSQNSGTQQEITFGLTNESHCLVSNPDGVSVSPSVLYFSEKEMVECLYMLKDSILKPGCLPIYKTYHGVTFFEDAEKKPALNRAFNETLTGSFRLIMDMTLKIYRGFEGVSEVIDVGGNMGWTIEKIVTLYPHIKGINFDLPHIIADAPEYPGVKHVAGDMFESLPNAETIFLKGILHDWNDDQCVSILRNCWKALPDNGKVIIAEFAIPEVLGTDIESEIVISLDFVMMVHQDGKERTVSEFDGLAKTAGFTETKVFPIGQGFHVLEFIKKSVV